VQKKLKTNLPYETLSKGELSCLPNPAGIKVTVKVENCRKIATEDSLCLFVQFIKMNFPSSRRI
jgi:hypothetical protein